MATIAICDDVIDQGNRTTKATSNFGDDLYEFMFKYTIDVPLRSSMGIDFKEIKIGVGQQVASFI